MPDDSLPTKQKRLDQLFELCLASAEMNFDPERSLIAQPAADNPDVKTYWGAGALPYAHVMFAKGETEKAEGIIAAMLDSQETNPEHPHRGNWKWLVDDPEVGDLNAIQFVMRWFLPILVNFSDKMSDELLSCCSDSIRLALGEQERMNIAPTFSNIHIGSLFALLVGSEWLGDDHYFTLGVNRWNRWVAFTLENGAPHEYNSPDYGGWQLSALASIVQYVQDPTIRLQARIMYERLWLHLVLHIHTPTGQIAGPHSRSYWYTMTAGRGMTKDTIWLESGFEWLLKSGEYGGNDSLPAHFMNLSLTLVDQLMPSYLDSWLATQNSIFPYEVRETANRHINSDITTYHSKSFALGTASSTYSIGTDCFYIEHEANYLMLHYTKPEDAGRWGMMYSRYVVNNRHWGTMGPAPDRPKEGNFYDHGNFAGVQKNNKAIALYALMPEQEEVFSLKTVVAFQSGESLDTVWINSENIDIAQPRTLAKGDWLIVEDGDVYIGIYPLEQSNLNGAAPIRLERGPLGELWLSIYNYDGAAIRFWDYASLKGAFWRGNLRAGFVVEVAEKDSFSSAKGFLEHLQTAQITDHVDNNHIRTVTYQSEDDALTIRYDLWNTRPVERLYNGSIYDPPQLESPLAVQGDTGYLRSGSAKLYSKPQIMILVAPKTDSNQHYVVMNPTTQSTFLRFETAVGTITAEEFGMGRLEIAVGDDGIPCLQLDCLVEPKSLSVPDHIKVIQSNNLSKQDLI